ncbi:hypothetical protein IOMTU433_0997 [Acinetobacter baumannii]|nr:hypothetical protein IOMTU433_0997 [Acinetobacter baumannii]
MFHWSALQQGNCLFMDNKKAHRMMSYLFSDALLTLRTTLTRI